MLCYSFHGKNRNWLFLYDFRQIITKAFHHYHLILLTLLILWYLLDFVCSFGLSTTNCIQSFLGSLGLSTKGVKLLDFGKALTSRHLFHDLILLGNNCFWWLSFVSFYDFELWRVMIKNFENLPEGTFSNFFYNL